MLTKRGIPFITGVTITDLKKKARNTGFLLFRKNYKAYNEEQKTSEIDR